VFGTPQRLRYDQGQRFAAEAAVDLKIGGVDGHDDGAGMEVGEQDETAETDSNVAVGTLRQAQSG
jgi:hypothetical protein